MASTVKNMPAVWETQVPSLGGKMPWRGEWLPNSSIQRSLADYSPWGHRDKHDCVTNIHTHGESEARKDKGRKKLKLLTMKRLVVWWFSHQVVSNSLQPCRRAVACQAPLSMEILQARILEWVAISFSRGKPN